MMSAMPMVSTTYVPSIEQLDAVLGFLPTLENPDFVPSTMDLKPGVMPYHVFHEDMIRFVRTLYECGFVVEFNWPDWQDEAVHIFESPDLISAADLLTIRKMITVHVRKQRYLDGHISEMVSCGHIAQLLRRVKVLRDAMIHATNS